MASMPRLCGVNSGKCRVRRAAQEASVASARKPRHVSDLVITRATTADSSNQWLDIFAATIRDRVLEPSEREALQNAFQGLWVYARDESVVRRDGKRAQLHLVVRGWAARLQMLDDGSEQITDFILPGEFCDLSLLTGRPADEVVALTPVRTVLLDRRAMLAALDQHPKLCLALLRIAFNDQATLRQWLVCLGRREKREHLAHLLCELNLRLRRAGMVLDDEFDLPLTQDQLGDALGMSAVHTNRILQQLRKEGILSFDHRHMIIHQPEALVDIAKFDGSYLEGRRSDLHSTAEKALPL